MSNLLNVWFMKTLYKKCPIKQMSDLWNYEAVIKEMYDQLNVLFIHLVLILNRFSLFTL